MIDSVPNPVAASDIELPCTHSLLILTDVCPIDTQRWNRTFDNTLM